VEIVNKSQNYSHWTKNYEKLVKNTVFAIESLVQFDYSSFLAIISSLIILSFVVFASKSKQFSYYSHLVLQIMCLLTTAAIIYYFSACTECLQEVWRKTLATTKLLYCENENFGRTHSLTSCQIQALESRVPYFLVTWKNRGLYEFPSLSYFWYKLPTRSVEPKTVLAIHEKNSRTTSQIGSKIQRPVLRTPSTSVYCRKTERGRFSDNEKPES